MKSNNAEHIQQNSEVCPMKTRSVCTSVVCSVFWSDMQADVTLYSEIAYETDKCLFNSPILNFPYLASTCLSFIGSIPGFIVPSLLSVIRLTLM